MQNHNFNEQILQFPKKNVRIRNSDLKSARLIVKRAMWAPWRVVVICLTWRRVVLLLLCVYVNFKRDIEHTRERKNDAELESSQKVDSQRRQSRREIVWRPEWNCDPRGYTLSTGEFVFAKGPVDKTRTTQAPFFLRPAEKLYPVFTFSQKSLVSRALRFSRRGPLCNGARKHPLAERLSPPVRVWTCESGDHRQTLPETRTSESTGFVF